MSEKFLIPNVSKNFKKQSDFLFWVSNDFWNPNFSSGNFGATKSLDLYFSKKLHEFRQFFGIFRPSKVTQCISSKNYINSTFLSAKFIFFKKLHEFRQFFRIFRPSKNTQYISSKNYISFAFLSAKFIFFKQNCMSFTSFSGYFGPVKSLNVFLPKTTSIPLSSPLNSYFSKKLHESHHFFRDISVQWSHSMYFFQKLHQFHFPLR